MLRRTWAITQKEFIQLFRYQGFVILLLFGTLGEVVLFATAIHTDIQHIPLAVADQSLSAESRAYLDAMVRSGSFDIVSTVTGQAELIKTIDSGQASLGILIPPDFAAQIKLHRATVLMLVDGSSSFISSSAYGAANAITQSYVLHLIRQPANPLNMAVRILYNPDANELWFIVPGLLAAIVQGVTMNLTTLAVVREREMGTIEALLVTPIRPVELMLGKTLPNLLVGLANVSSIILFCTLVYHVPFQGSLLLFFALAVLFAFGGLGLGLVISVAARTQLQAQLLGAMVNFIGFFLAGFLFPVYALPPVLRYLGYVFPMTYFLPITRGIMIKGVGLNALWGQIAGSAILVVLIVIAASRLFRQSLD